ncbi:GNAT family N-acetyltransferase [Candidatus Woesearchaeota archaeon]|nr:GNAT family N-acetyltransferase [Candidatus Woesearchaeota archaeon]
MLIRKATLDDVHHISEVVQVLDFEKVKPSSHLRLICQQVRKGNYYVALNQKKIIVGAMCLIFEENSCQIYLLASKEKGGGIALLRFAEDLCRKTNTPKLWCWSLVRYDASVFYKKNGFEEAYLLRKQWFGEDCWFFGKVLH